MLLAKQLLRSPIGNRLGTRLGKRLLQRGNLGSTNGPGPWGPVDHTIKLYHHDSSARVHAISAVSFRWFRSVARIDARHADGAVLPHTGAKRAQVINFESWGVVCLNDGGFAVKSGQPAHWLGRHSMMLVLFISAVALLSLAFVPDLSL